MSLIAKVLVGVLVEGQRVAFQPGDEIPEGILPDHDVRELKAMRSIEDTEDTARTEKADAAADKAAAKEFAEAKKRVVEANASVQAGKKPAAK